MYVELIVDPSTEVWYGLVEFDWSEEEIEYEEPEFRRRTRAIRISDFKSRRNR
jgi:hypothetical protein